MLEGFVPWPEEYVSSYKEKGYWEDVTLGEHFGRWVKQYADRPALAYQGKDISYREMDEYATKLAYHMIQLGIKTYDRVVMQLFNVPELVYLIYACMKIGAIPICSLPTHRWSEISFLARESEARVHAIPAGRIKDFDYETFAEKVREESPNLKYILTVGKSKHPEMASINDLVGSDVDLTLAKAKLAQCHPDPMEPAIFQLSGGTTGVPKIIPRTHNDYYYNTKCCAKALEYNENFRLLITMPLMHNAPLVTGLLPLHSRGGTIVLTHSLAPESLLQAIMENKVNTMQLIPVHGHRILGLPLEVREKYDLSSLKRCIGSWSPQDKEMERFFGHGCKGVQTYGMAEGLICWTRWHDPVERRHYTHGCPVSEADETKIVDPNTGTEVSNGEIGEMRCRGPYTIRGYYKSPDRNKQAFTPDGYYKTGDLVRMDAYGNITWSGRIKDCIDRGGEKINAEEVEEHILKFHKVKEVAAVAMPDKEMGERVCVFVVKQPGEPFSLEELCGFLLNERSIARFKLPERLEFLDELPVTKLGKTVDKKSLREKITEILKSEGKL